MFMYNELLDLLKKVMFFEGKVMSIYEVESDLAKFLLYKDEKSVFEADEYVEGNKRIISKTIFNNEEMKAEYDSAIQFVDVYDIDVFAVMIVIARKANVPVATVENMIKVYEKLGSIARLNELNEHGEITSDIENLIQKLSEVKNSKAILEKVFEENHLDKEEGITTLASEINEKFIDEMKDINIYKGNIYAR